MAKIDLSLSAKKSDTSERQEIMIRFYHGRINLRAKSGIFILDNPAYWDGHKMVDTRRTNDEERRYHNECRAKLESMCKAIDEAWQQAQGGDIPVPLTNMPLSACRNAKWHIVGIKDTITNTK